MTDRQSITCPLCRRPLNGKVTRHHPYPQKHGRKKGHKAHANECPVVDLHKIYHRMIHALFSEKYLAEHRNTTEALGTHPQMQSFLAFIEEKLPSFDVGVRRRKGSKEASPEYCRNR